MRQLLLILLTLPAIVCADELYPSGLVKTIDEPTPRPGARADAETAFRAFIDDNFAKYPDFQWRVVDTLADNTHIHRLYSLYYKNRRVMDHYLKLHYNRKGWLQYATNLWEKIFSLRLPNNTAVTHENLRIDLQGRYSTDEGRFDGKLETEPVIWIENSKAVPAFEVKLSVLAGRSRRQNQFRHLILEEGSNRILEERKVIRNLDLVSKGWKVSPFTSDGNNNNPPTDVTLNHLNDVATIVSPNFHVRREENLTTPTLVEIDPSITIPPFTFDNDPNLNNGDTCTGNSTGCNNQRIDGTNVYYHLDTYRNTLEEYFAEMGVSPVPMAKSEPIDVIINAFTVNVDGNSDQDDETNNAGYIPRVCTSSGGTEIPFCIVFLRPAPVTSLVCGSNKKFFDLAREAMVIEHEYTHFVIDSIIKLVPGSFQKRVVGDAIHEGFSDYFAASHVSVLAGTDVTKIGEYGFQQCTFFQRDVATLRVYENSEDEKDEHIAGLSWASGLWQLRKEFQEEYGAVEGRERADRMALKSIFFYSPRPGFVEVIEALVKADEALNEGKHVARIRKLFYDEIKFVGGQTDVFRDPATGIVEVGFKSCNSVHWGTASPLPWLWSTFVWIQLMVLSGRGLVRLSKKRKE